MHPFTALKNLSPFHFTFYLFFFHLSYQPFTSLYFAIHLYNSLPFTSLPFTSYLLSPSLPPPFYTFLTLVLKIKRGLLRRFMDCWGKPRTDWVGIIGGRAEIRFGISFCRNVSHFRHLLGAVQSCSHVHKSLSLQPDETNCTFGTELGLLCTVVCNLSFKLTRSKHTLHLDYTNQK